MLKDKVFKADDGWMGDVKVDGVSVEATEWKTGAEGYAIYLTIGPDGIVEHTKDGVVLRTATGNVEYFPDENSFLRLALEV